MAVLTSSISARSESFSANTAAHKDAMSVVHEAAFQPSIAQQLLPDIRPRCQNQFLRHVENPLNILGGV